MNDDEKIKVDALITMMPQGVLLYMFLSNFVTSLGVLSINAGMKLLSWSALGISLAWGLGIMVLFIIFLSGVRVSIEKTGKVDPPFVVVKLNSDLEIEYSSDDSNHDTSN